MEWLNVHWLTFITFLPFVLGMFGLLLPTRTDANKALYKGWILFSTLVVFVTSLKLLFLYEPNGAEFQIAENVDWLPALGIRYIVGIDGVSLCLILLTTFLMPIVILGSFHAVEERIKEYYFLLLALQSGMIGAFVALDVFLFYVFWEVMLVPMYFLIGIWGGKERIYASMKFILYTLVGSLLMLVAIFYLAREHELQFGTFTTGLTDLYRVKVAFAGPWSPQALLFMAFSLAFAIKVPLFPLHTWLPDAHVQAPTAGSVVLAGVLLKMGGYGFIRFAFPLFPESVLYFKPLFMTLAAIAIVYGALVAMIQPDIKKLVAYSSVSHMGYVVLGLFSLTSVGVMGSVYQMLNHGISTGALFLVVGMIYERRHTREIKDFGGISKVMPLFAVAFLIITLSSVALPGTNGFVGEFLILLGAWFASPWLAVVAASGVIFGAVYMLWMFQRVMFGPITHAENQNLKDLSGREIVVLTPLLIAIFVMGVAPNPFFRVLEPTLNRFVERVSAQQPTQVALKVEGSQPKEGKAECRL